jgi:hypothetical protein
VEARVDAKTGWQNIATAPRDGQWFWASKNGRIYRAYWCTKRQCFIHTTLNLRVNPTHWKWD